MNTNIAALLPFLLAFTCLHAAGASTASSSDLLADRSSSGYQVKAIRGWEAKTSEAGDPVDAYFSHTEPLIEINIIVLEDTGIDTLDETFLEIVYQEAIAPFTNVERQHLSGSTFQRRPSGSYSFTATDASVSPPQPLFLHQQIILDGSRFIVVSIACEAGEAEATRPLWTAFLQQIELVEPGS